MRQATRELIKGYAEGVTSEELSEVFTMIIWNQGVGTFASEIGPSPLFDAFKRIKEEESKGTTHEDIVEILKRELGESNPKKSVLRQY